MNERGHNSNQHPGRQQTGGHPHQARLKPELLGQARCIATAYTSQYSGHQIPPRAADSSRYKALGYSAVDSARASSLGR